MKHTKLAVALLFAAANTILAQSNTNYAAPTTFPIPLPAGARLLNGGINGDVVYGSYALPVPKKSKNTNTAHGFLWDKTGFSLIDAPDQSDDSTSVLAINSSGSILGTYHGTNTAVDATNPALIGLVAFYSGPNDTGFTNISVPGANFGTTIPGGFTSLSGGPTDVVWGNYASYTNFPSTSSVVTNGFLWYGSGLGGAITNISVPGATHTVLTGGSSSAPFLVGYFEDSSHITHGLLFDGTNMDQVDFPDVAGVWKTSSTRLSCIDPVNGGIVAGTFTRFPAGGSDKPLYHTSHAFVVVGTNPPLNIDYPKSKSSAPTAIANGVVYGVYSTTASLSTPNTVHSYSWDPSTGYHIIAGKITGGNIPSASGKYFVLKRAGIPSYVGGPAPTNQSIGFYAWRPPNISDTNGFTAATPVTVVAGSSNNLSFPITYDPLPSNSCVAVTYLTNTFIGIPGITLTPLRAGKVTIVARQAGSIHTLPATNSITINFPLAEQSVAAFFGGRVPSGSDLVFKKLSDRGNPVILKVVSGPATIDPDGYTIHFGTVPSHTPMKKAVLDAYAKATPICSAAPHVQVTFFIAPAP